VTIWRWNYCYAVGAYILTKLFVLEQFEEAQGTMTAHINEKGQLVNELGEIISEDAQLLMDEAVSYKKLSFVLFHNIWLHLGARRLPSITKFDSDEFVKVGKRVCSIG